MRPWQELLFIPWISFFRHLKEIVAPVYKIRVQSYNYVSLANIRARQNQSVGLCVYYYRVWQCRRVMKIRHLPMDHSRHICHTLAVLPVSLFHQRSHATWEATSRFSLLWTRKRTCKLGNWRKEGKSQREGWGEGGPFMVEGGSREESWAAWVALSVWVSERVVSDEDCTVVCMSGRALAPGWVTYVALRKQYIYLYFINICIGIVEFKSSHVWDRYTIFYLFRSTGIAIVIMVLFIIKQYRIAFKQRNCYMTCKNRLTNQPKAALFQNISILQYGEVLNTNKTNTLLDKTNIKEYK